MIFGARRYCASWGLSFDAVLAICTVKVLNEAFAQHF
jgi:hypothetical protein